MKCGISLPLLLLLAATATAHGQASSEEVKEYMYEVGLGGGISVAYGDINRSGPLYHPAGAGGLVFRYNANPRWAVCFDLASLGLKGDARDFDGVFPGDAAFSIDSRYWQLSCRPEFHFWNYGWSGDYREKQRIAPFLTAGLGFGLASAAEQPTDGTAPADGKRSTAFTASVPLGAGIKWKMTPRWNAQMTCLFTKTFSDRTDGLEDPMGIPHGALKNTDWIGSLLFSVTFDFKERCVECRNQHSY